MVRIAPFEVEQWMDRYETTPGVLNIAESCADSLSVDDLVALSTDRAAPGPLQLSRKMVYGAIRGSDALRQRIAAIYSRQVGADQALPPESVLVTQGAIIANFLLLYTLVGAGDHVVCAYPTYQQLYGVPESLGAEVSLWKLKKEKAFIPDLTELEGLVKSNTKMIIINNPNNPTGAVIPTSVLGGLVAFARQRGITILSDEVYQPLFHALPGGAPPPPPSILSFGYDKTIATGSMSKAYSLAGIRVGWIASRDRATIEAVAAARDYTTISVSQLDDQVAAYALSDAVRPAIIARNTRLAMTNLALLEAFVRKHADVCSWVRPVGGTTAFVQFHAKDGEPVDDQSFCLDVLESTKVFFLPGSKCFGHEKDFRGYVRIGYVSETEVLREALAKLSDYVERNLA